MFSGTLNLVCTFVAIIFLYSLGQKLRKSSTDEIDLIEVFAQLPGHVYWKDRNYIFKGSNINNWQDFGASSLEEILGKTDYDIFSKEQADMIRANDEEVLRSGCLQVIEEPATNPDGSTTLYLSYKVPVKDKIGKSVGLLGISIDITQAKRDVEDKLKKILEDIIASMPGHVYWVDINGVYLGCNDNQAKSAGLNSRNEIVGKRNKDLPWNSNVNEIVNFLDTVNQEIITKRITLSLEEPAVLNNTKAVFLSIKSPLYNTVGEVVGMVGTSIDITDRKKAETIRQEEQSNFRKNS
jgi:PAS domain-containing protein